MNISNDKNKIMAAAASTHSQGDASHNVKFVQVRTFSEGPRLTRQAARSNSDKLNAQPYEAIHEVIRLIDKNPERDLLPVLAYIVSCVSIEHKNKTATLRKLADSRTYPIYEVGADFAAHSTAVKQYEGLYAEVQEMMDGVITRLGH